MVSIIIPVYNVKKQYLDECINSVLGQDYTDIEVLLVDDGALGDLPQTLDEYALTDKRIRVIHQENAGASAARNAGLGQMKGEYVTFVDSDDSIASQTISEAVYRADEANLDILLWGSYKCYGDRREKYMPYSSDIRLFEGERKEELMLKTMAGSLPFYKEPATKYGSGSCCSKLYRSDFLRENNLLYPVGVKRAEDVNFNIRCFDAASRIGYLDRYFYYYRQHEESATYQYREGGYQIFSDALLGLREFLDETDKPELFYQIYYQRCIFFLLESMDMDYLNPQNKKPLFKRMAEFRKVMNQNPYSEAAELINMKYMSLMKRIPVILIRFRLVGLLWIFYSLYRRIS